MGRPLGITIVAVVLAILGIASIGFGLLAMGVFTLSGFDANAVENAKALGAAGIVVGVAQLVVAWALWTLKGWAWLLTVVLQGINVVLGVVQILAHGMTGSAPRGWGRSS